MASEGHEMIVTMVAAKQKLWLIWLFHQMTILLDDVCSTGLPCFLGEGPAHVLILAFSDEGLGQSALGFF